MAVRTWILGTIGRWFDPANWTAGQVPVLGDSAVINAGTAIVASSLRACRFCWVGSTPESR